MTTIIICREVSDNDIRLWCPYCDEVNAFAAFEYYEDVTCRKCGRRFPPHHWPRGFDLKTGKLKTPRRDGPITAGDK